jgi:hypothetical protein
LVVVRRTQLVDLVVVLPQMQHCRLLVTEPQGKETLVVTEPMTTHARVV